MKTTFALSKRAALRRRRAALHRRRRRSRPRSPPRSRQSALQRQHLHLLPRQLSRPFLRPLLRSRPPLPRPSRSAAGSRRTCGSRCCAWAWRSTRARRGAPSLGAPRGRWSSRTCASSTRPRRGGARSRTCAVTRARGLGLPALGRWRLRRVPARQPGRRVRRAYRGLDSALAREPRRVSAQARCGAGQDDAAQVTACAAAGRGHSHRRCRAQRRERTRT
jgi:hypothetical protein